MAALRLLLVAAPAALALTVPTAPRCGIGGGVARSSSPTMKDYPTPQGIFKTGPYKEGEALSRKMAAYAWQGEKKTVAIVGGGLSGLACAKYLADAGHTPMVYEARDVSSMLACLPNRVASRMREHPMRPTTQPHFRSELRRCLEARSPRGRTRMATGSRRGSTFSSALVSARTARPRLLIKTYTALEHATHYFSLVNSGVDARVLLGCARPIRLGGSGGWPASVTAVPIVSRVVHFL